MRHLAQAMLIVFGLVIAGPYSGVHAQSGTASKPTDAPSRYRTLPLTRGNIVRAVVAAGRLDAVVTVKVSSQLSGQVAALLVNYNDRVTKGQPLARLDDQTYRARVAESRARVINAQAAFKEAEALAAAARVRLQDLRNDYTRKQRLAGKRVISERELESLQSKILEARSALAAAEARIEVRKSDIAVARASLDEAETNLSRTIIRAPIDGIVIERNVDLGQTVAASLQAPTLFTIAQDLSDMELLAFVDEADIGLIENGQNVVFRVDAFPGRYFPGRVTAIRKAPKVIQNVTTYTVVISARNPQRILLPGMTATIRIVVADRRGVLRAPNAAFTVRLPGNRSASPPARGTRFLWTVGDDGSPRRISVKTGIRNDTFTEIASVSGDEAQPAPRPGMRVIVGVVRQRQKRNFWQRLFGER